MSGITLRQAAAQAYANYELGDLTTPDPDQAFGDRITVETPDLVQIGDWTARYAPF